VASLAVLGRLYAWPVVYPIADWRALQVLALVSAWTLFFARAKGSSSRLVAVSILASAGAVLGAITLAPALRTMGWVAGGLRGAPPAFGEIMGYGAIFGCVGALALLAPALAKLDRKEALDAFAPSLGVAVFVARIGCFFAGCDHGAPSTLPWAVTYPPGSHAFALHVERGLIASTQAASLPLHPTQLYEAAVGLAMVAIGWKAQQMRGSAFRASLFVYAAGRFVTEFFRGDANEARLGGLTTPQWLSIAVIGALVALQSRRNKELSASQREARSLDGPSGAPITAIQNEGD
jgi:phosphatidylglycerol:prolipoprotein diacylglycerol transferase